MSRYNSKLQRLVKRLLPKPLKESYQRSVNQSTLNRWKRAGEPSPPPHIVKVKTVEKFQQLTKYSTLVETGTFMGDMIQSQLQNFDKIYSIELSEDYWKNAKELFKNEKKVELLKGDSGQVMHELVKQLNQPAVFWLDGHYSGGNTAKGEKLSPIYEELKAIFSTEIKHCLLIDDARLFSGENDYPTIDELKKFILGNRPASKIEIEADTISVIY